MRKKYSNITRDLWAVQDPRHEGGFTFGHGNLALGVAVQRPGEYGPKNMHQSFGGLECHPNQSTEFILSLQ